MLQTEQSELIERRRFALSPRTGWIEKLARTGAVATSFTFTYAVSLCVRFLLLSVADHQHAGRSRLRREQAVRRDGHATGIARLNVACPLREAAVPAR